MSPQKNRPRSSRLGLVLILLALGYGAWRLFLFATGSGSVDAADLAFRPMPYVMYGLKPDFQRRGSLAKTSNSLGFRGPEVAVPKPAGTYRIVCLGGSTTYSNLVGDADTYPLRLQEILRERHPELDIEVVNAGVESYTTAESINNLAFRCLDLEPDAIVVYHACNDYRPRRYANFDDAYLHYRKPWDGSTDDYENLGGDLGGINFFIQHPSPDDNGSEPGNIARAGTRAYERNLKTLAGIAAVHGIQPLFVTMATSKKHSDAADPSMYAGILEMNAAMKSVCDEIGVPCLDLAADFPTGDDIMLDAVHMSPEGCRLKAEVIADELDTLLP